MRSRWWLATALAISLVPGIAAEGATPTATTLYMHLLGVEDFPINTQEPAATWGQDTLYGATTSTATCASQLAGNTGGFGNEYHTFYGYSHPQTVHYDDVDPLRVRAEPVRGLAADVELVSGSQANLVWYVSSDAGLNTVLSQPPLALPNVVLRATLRTGNAISVDDVAYNAGQVVLDGQSTPATLAGPLAYGLNGQPSPFVKALGQVGDRWLYEFTLPLDVHAHLLPQAAGFNLRVDLYVDNPLCADPGGQGYAMPNLVAMHTSPDYRPRLEVTTGNPLWSIARAELQGPHLLLLASVGSAWGAYDVDAAAAQLDVTGPGPHGFIPLDVDDSGLAGGIVQSARVLAWLWPNAMEDVHGRYDVRITVPNQQGTATTTATTEIALAPDGEAPGPAPGIVAAGLLALAVLVRRGKA